MLVLLHSWIIHMIQVQCTMIVQSLTLFTLVKYWSSSEWKTFRNYIYSYNVLPHWLELFAYLNHVWILFIGFASSDNHSVLFHKLKAFREKTLSTPTTLPVLSAPKAFTKFLNSSWNIKEFTLLDFVWKFRYYSFIPKICISTYVSI